jgi:ferrochelatase
LTAHGLPKRIVDAGDPYPGQVEMTARLIVDVLASPGLDWRVCYQSRVGPLEWIGPATDSEIRRAGADNVPLVVAPISFVSEHSETLVELDLDYRRVAESSGVPAYHRVATVGVEPRFIVALAKLVIGAGLPGSAACSAADAARSAFAGASP